MTSRICKYGCETVLEGWDDNAKKYIEAGTGGLHTRERCEEAKAKLAAKNDHGNEETKTISVSHGTGEKSLEYVDHTAARPSKVKLFKGTVNEVETAYNEFLATPNRFAWTRAQLQFDNGVIVIALYYEEIKQ